MTNAEYWWVALAIFGAVVVVVAVLLGWVIAAARKVDDHAHAIWNTGKQIAANTTAIWMLDETVRQLGEVRGAVGSMDRSLASLADGLSWSDPGGGGP